MKSQLEFVVANANAEFLTNFPARYQFVTDLRKTNISFKTKIFYENVLFGFSSPTLTEPLVEF